MNKLQSDDVENKIRDFFDKITKKLSPDVIEELKQVFQTSMITNLTTKKETDLQVKLVVDSNAVIRSLIRYAKTGESSLLHKLKSNPLFPLYSPINLETEVIDYIEHKEKNQEYKPKMRKAWNSIKQNITVKEEIDTKALNKAKKVIGKRDPDDIPFVGVYFDLNASGIITYDEDYKHQEIKKFSLESLGEIVGTFHRGMFSFFILDDLSPSLLEFIMNIFLSIIKFLYECLVSLLRFIKALATETTSKISELLSNMPSWLVSIILGAIGVGTIAMLSHDTTQNKIKSLVQNIKEEIEHVLERIWHVMKNCFEKLIEYAESSPYVDITLATIKEVFEDIEELKAGIQTLFAEESLASS